jgi:hypothetical protein
MSEKQPAQNPIITIDIDLTIGEGESAKKFGGGIKVPLNAPHLFDILKAIVHATERKLMELRGESPLQLQNREMQ